MTSLPMTPEDFAALEAAGMTVESAETPDAQTPPDGEGWVYWSDRVVQDESGNVVESAAVWRRIVPIEETSD